jgi:hypothetical protein
MCRDQLCRVRRPRPPSLATLCTHARNYARKPPPPPLLLAMPHVHQLDAPSPRAHAHTSIISRQVSYHQLAYSFPRSKDNFLHLPKINANSECLIAVIQLFSKYIRWYAPKIAKINFIQDWLGLFHRSKWNFRIHIQNVSPKGEFIRLVRENIVIATFEVYHT